MEEALTTMTIDYGGVELRQDSRPVLTDISLHVSEGELVYITGEVGSGKSSLLKSLYGELPIAQGQAQVLGTNICKIRPRRLPRLRRRMGIIFQDFQLLRDRTISENLNFVLRATGWKKAGRRRERIDEVLSQVGMGDSLKKMPHELSGGEQQSVCIARALLNEPALLIADEPTANLDTESGKRVMALLCSICEKGTTVVMSTHNDNLPRLFPGRIFRCEGGHLTEQEKEEEESTTDNTQET